MTYKTFFRYRSVWMLFAILCIIMYHQSAESSHAFIKFFLYYGYFGVDIFFFASGIGCYFSFKKNGYSQFLKHRVIRIFPAFLPFMLVWCTVMLVKKKISILSAVGNMLSLQLFIDPNESFNWYICAMWILYFLTPVFSAGADRIKKKSSALLWVILLILITLPTIPLNIGKDTHLLVTRIPVFFLGMCFAKFSTKDEKIPWYVEAGFLACIPIGVFVLIYCSMHYSSFLVKYGVYWYTFIGIAPAVCMLISLMCSVMEKNAAGKHLVNLFNRLGSYSFEIFLLHFTAIAITTHYIDRYAIGQKKALLLFFTVISVGVLILRTVEKPVLRALINLDKKRSAAA